MELINNEFLLFLKCAFKSKLRYLIIGGYAVNFYGYSRNTSDLDIWIAPTKENKKLFIDTLLCMKYSEREVVYLLDEDFTVPFIGYFGSPGNDIDMLTVVHHSLSFDEAEKTTSTFEIEPGLFINFISYDLLIKSKLLSRRPKDLLDISELNKLREPKNKK